MIKRILITVFNFFVISVSSQRCFVMTDVINSQSLFTYQGNVYDIANYVHPGGRNSISQVVGTSLEPFLQQPRYSFHLTSNSFRNDMLEILVGVLRDNCQPVLTTIAPVLSTVAPVLTTIAPVLTTIAPIVTTIAPIMNATIAPTLVNCVPQNLDLNISYNQQNFIADYNINNIYQVNNYIKMSLLENIGGTRISSTNYLQYGKVDITMKTPKGFNVITSFYLETDNGDIVNFNIINKDKLSVIDTNFYNNLNPDFNTNSKTYDQPLILTDTFTKFSLIKTINSYEWQINDVTLRILNVNNTINCLSKIKISIWEAPASTWGGPGIQWAMNPYDLFISELNVNCSLMNKSLVDTNDEEYDEDYDEDYDPNNCCYLNPNIKLLIALFILLILY